MKCVNCQSEIADDSKFCPICGTKVKRITYCQHCGQKNETGGKFCKYCGHPFDTPQREIVRPETSGESEPQIRVEPTHDFQGFTPTSFQDVQSGITEEEKKVNWTAVICAFVAMIVVFAGSIIYLNVSPGLNMTNSGSNPSTTAPTFTAVKSTETDNLCNTAALGLFACDGDNVFMLNDSGQLVKLTKEFKDPQVLADSANNITLVDNYVYFTDSNDALCRITKDGKDLKTIISDKCFYVTYHDNKLYYQNDTDSETLHVYDLKTEKDEKLTEKMTYNISFDDGGVYMNNKDAILYYNFKTKETNTVLEAQCNKSIYYEGSVYYLSNGVLASYDVKKKETTNSVNNVINFTFSDDNLYLYNGSLAQYDGDQNITLYDGYLSTSYFVQVNGKNLVFYDGANWYTLNTETKEVARIFN